MNHFAKNIRYLRKKNNMSQNELADKLGYKSFTTIQKWETNNSEPTLSTLSKLSDIFNTNLSRLCEVDLRNDITIYRTFEEERLLKNYNSTTEKGKNRIQTTAEEMVELYPITDILARHIMLDFFKDNDIQIAAFGGKDLNSKTDEELYTLYNTIKDTLN